MEGVWFQPQQSFRSGGWRRRKRPYRVGGGAFLSKSDSTGSSGYQKEESSISDQQTSERPTKMHMDDMISKGAEIKCSSPSMIEKLMGLDDLQTPQIVPKQQKAIHCCFQELPCAVSPDRYVTKDCTLSMSTYEHPEFKNAFQVMGSSNMEKNKAKPISMAIQNFQKSEPDFTFARKKFVVDTDFSIDQALRTTVESNDALEDQDFSKEFFIKVNPETKPFFTKYLHGVKYNKSLHLGRCVANLKSSGGTKYEGSVTYCRSEKKIRRCTDQNDGINSVRKRNSSLFSPSLKDYSNFRLAKLCYEGKNDSCTRPFQDIVFKSSLKKDYKLGSSISLPRHAHNVQLSNILQATRSRFLELHARGRDQQSLSNNVEDLSRTRGSREITRVVKMKQSINIDTKMVSGVGLDSYLRQKVDNGQLYVFKDLVYLGRKDYLCSGFSSKRRTTHDRNELQSFKFNRDEHKLPLKEMHMRPEDLRKKPFAKAPEPNLPHSVGTIVDAANLDNMFSVSSCMDVDMLVINNRDMAQEVTADVVATQNEEISCNYQKEASSGHPALLELPSMDGTETQPMASASIKQAVQPSSTYVHEYSLTEDNSELRMQVQIAKSNSEDTCRDSSAVQELHNVHNFNFESLQQNKDMEEFRDEEERDFSYLLDVLIESGILGNKKERLCDASCLLERGMGTDVFEKLEKRYSKLALWSDSERKLFFDFINSILVESLAPCIYLHPWVNSASKVGLMWGFQGFAEKAWQTLIRKRKEFSVGNAEEKLLDTKWLYLGDDIYDIGKKIGRMLEEELLEELVSEFILG